MSELVPMNDGGEFLLYQEDAVLRKFGISEFSTSGTAAERDFLLVMEHPKPIELQCKSSSTAENE